MHLKHFFLVLLLIIAVGFIVNSSFNDDAKNNKSSHTHSAKQFSDKQKKAINVKF